MHESYTQNHRLANAAVAAAAAAVATLVPNIRGSGVLSVVPLRRCRHDTFPRGAE